MKNSVDHDKTPQKATSDQGLQSFLMPIYPNAYGKYGMRRTKIPISLRQGPVLSVNIR